MTYWTWMHVFYLWICMEWYVTLNACQGGCRCSSLWRWWWWWWWWWVWHCNHSRTLSCLTASKWGYSCDWCCHTVKQAANRGLSGSCPTFLTHTFDHFVKSVWYRRFKERFQAFEAVCIPTQEVCEGHTNVKKKWEGIMSTCRINVLLARFCHWKQPICTFFVHCFHPFGLSLWKPCTEAKQCLNSGCGGFILIQSTSILERTVLEESEVVSGYCWHSATQKMKDMRAVMKNRINLC